MFGALWFRSLVNVLCTVVQIIFKYLVHCGSGHPSLFSLGKAREDAGMFVNISISEEFLCSAHSVHDS